MSSRSIQYIEEGGEDQEKMDCTSKCKKLTNCLKKIKLLGEIDFFSLDVKFMIKGEETFRTLFSGFIGFITLIVLGFITYMIAWPETFTSKIVETSYKGYSSSTNLSLFSFVQEPISLQIKPFFPSYQVPSELEVNFYYVRTGQAPQKLDYDTKCKYGTYCLTKNVNKGKNLQIFGTPDSSGSIAIEVFWCQFTDPNCVVIAEMFDFIITFQNTLKQREKKLIPYTESNILRPVSSTPQYSLYTYSVIREKYTSNNKIMGHISNLFPESFETYSFEKFPEQQLFFDESYLLFPKPSKQSLFRANFKYGEKKADINEKFINIITPVLFLFSLLDPFKWVLNQFFLKKYNQNCLNLYIANKIFYVEDLENYEKYNFGGGIIVFFVCLMHQHVLMRIFGWIIGLFGRNFVDIFPQKCIHTMNMIDKGASIMSQNVFFGSLQELSTLEDCPGKKVPFNEEDSQQQEEEDQTQVNYYPDNPIRKAAFVRFCKDNEYITARRKNKVYEILLDNKFTTFLKDGIHKQFETYVRNIENLKISGKLSDTLQDMNIPVEMVESNSRGDETHSNMKFGKNRQQP